MSLAPVLMQVYQDRQPCLLWIIADPVQRLALLGSYLCSLLVFYDSVLCSEQTLYWEELNGCC